jgi:hypothetical protein
MGAHNLMLRLLTLLWLDGVQQVSRCSQDNHWNKPTDAPTGTNGFHGEMASEQAKSDSKSNPDFLKFEPFTRSPIQTKIVVPELLTAEQLDWLNEYNTAVREALLPIYEAAPAERYAQWQVSKEQMIAFLMKETEPVKPKPAARM